MSESLVLVRALAQQAIAMVDRVGGDGPKLLEGLNAPMQKLIARDDLTSLGVKREANHIDWSRYLYYDGRLVITIDLLPKGKYIPPHDHGTWEAMCIYKGSVDHKVYDRLDDGTKFGFADLKLIDDRVLTKTDFVVVAPPTEIHSFTSLEDDTYSLTIVGGAYKPDRHYYNPAEKSYVVRRPKAVPA
uniref:Cysteine dioxygenase n=1 Tax=uncultured bacterium 1114 TaxID=548901 RepID=B8R932_9BACT|nr:hypothetical protein [uncultured bacterium 1114]